MEGENHAVPRNPRRHHRRRQHARGNPQGDPPIAGADDPLNGIEPADVASAIFSTTADLDAEFPALAARQLGWFDVALMCVHELDVPGSLRRCIRILLHWNTDKPADEIVHVYVKEARRLRPDRSTLPPVDWTELEQWIVEHSNEVAKPAGK